MTNKEFTQLYEKVFNEDGSVKYCGRKACIELIDASYSLGIGNFGDRKTGFMNIEAIQDLRVQLDEQNVTV